MKREARARRLPPQSRPLDPGADTILNFVKWCQGQLPLEEALTPLINYVGADAICLLRRDRNRRGLRSVLIQDTNKDLRKPRLHRPFALEILGQHIDALKAGVVLHLSQMRHEPEEQDVLLTDWVERRGIREISVLCLGNENGFRDMIEVHFSRTPPPEWTTRADELAFLLSEIFAGRRHGLLDNMIFGKQSSDPCADEYMILAPENPAGLTRTEWRLCLLISNGLSKGGIANEMQITENTVRTHLRNVYAKTGHNSFHSLARQLVSADERRLLATARPREAA